MPKNQDLVTVAWLNALTTHMSYQAALN